jgi:hypothetical protein
MQKSLKARKAKMLYYDLKTLNELNEAKEHKRVKATMLVSPPHKLLFSSGLMVLSFSLFKFNPTTLLPSY